MDNDKVFDLLERLYGEIQGLKQGQTEIKSEMSQVKTEVSQVKDEVSQIKDEVKQNTKAIISLETKIENEVLDKIRSLYDAREVTNTKLDEISEKVDDLKLDVNHLTLKVTMSDTEIIELKRTIKQVR